MTGRVLNLKYTDCSEHTFQICLGISQRWKSTSSCLPFSAGPPDRTLSPRLAPYGAFKMAIFPWAPPPDVKSASKDIIFLDGTWWFNTRRCQIFPLKQILVLFFSQHCFSRSIPRNMSSIKRSPGRRVLAVRLRKPPWRQSAGPEGGALPKRPRVGRRKTELLAQGRARSHRISPSPSTRRKEDPFLPQQQRTSHGWHQRETIPTSDLPSRINSGPE